MRRFFIIAAMAAALPVFAADKIDKPNIVYILCDDLGYGDISALNPQRGKIKTPCLDRLAGQGMVFTDAHSGSSVCTPTRYGILTGRYAWRTRLQSGVLGGFSPPLIDAGRLTVPALLRSQGYETACIGKWHLGMTMPGRPGTKMKDSIEDIPGEKMNWTNPITDGPTSRGFDHYFGISASLDMSPFAFIENDRFTQSPTAVKKWLRSGPAAPDFEAVDVLPRLTKRTCEFIAARKQAGKDGKPFFIYLPLASPHTPIVPTKEWQGQSGVSEYADFVMQTDAAVGGIMKALDQAGLAENTLLLFTSDNGCSPAAKTEELEAKGHFASADRRGYKADIWDGGHRVPFMARWPGKIAPATTNSTVICLTDLMATCAEITGAKLPDNAGEDSVSILSMLLGRNDGPKHEAVIHHSIQGRFAIRQGNWKLELCPGSGGWSSPRDPAAIKDGLPAVQLYDMATDVCEKKNMQSENSEVASRLTKLLERFVADGRSTPGAPQANDVPVDIWKKGRKNAE